MNLADPLSDLHPRLGDAPFTQLVAAFYTRVRTDDLLSPMYPNNDWEGAQARLRGFLIQRCGGPDTYSQERGHPRLRMRHAPFPIDLAARNRWVKLMDEALTEANLSEADTTLLHTFFEQVATQMMNR
ncbi:MAG: globin [Algisphaera sp.]